MSAGFERSSSSWPNATTSPTCGRKRRSSPPTCPFFPVSKIRGFISQDASVDVLAELEQGLGTSRLFRKQSERSHPRIFLGSDHSRRCHVRPLERRSRCICKEIEPFP